MDSIKDILRRTGFRFNRNLGQNFLTDTNLLSAIVEDSGLLDGETVVEIGTGAGTLTRALSAKAKRVISFEVDENLKPVLEETLKGLDNVEVVFADVLKLSDSRIAELCGDSFRVVANIPYYITTSLIMRFIESGLNVTSITVMVQKEVADRLAAKESTSDYGAITMSVKLRGDAKITRLVNRNLFYPAPNVDSAVS
jgi:16S rRNA (adenine1518-N6/adenine1519-N6)-dimethyltransferase